jgi:hypothetical protein
MGGDTPYSLYLPHSAARKDFMFFYIIHKIISIGNYEPVKEVSGPQCNEFLYERVIRRRTGVPPGKADQHFLPILLHGCTD